MKIPKLVCSNVFRVLKSVMLMGDLTHSKFREFGVYLGYMTFKNTPENGSVRSIIFEQNGEWFGVALEFNIVETGTSPQEVSLLLDEAIEGYIAATDKSKLSIGVLNQEVEPEYEALWQQGITERKGLYRRSEQPLTFQPA